MTRETGIEKWSLDSNNAAIPFTARLNAYYRAIESKLDEPLLIDPLAERLAGDMTEYFAKHKRVNDMGGSQIARSYYIENKLLTPWCSVHESSQIVLLGAGLDTRVYRFSPLLKNSHSVFELDLPVIINYKEKTLKNEKPLCKLIRISTDLSKSNWIFDLRERGYSHEIPSFWILEGFVYYVEYAQVHNLLTTISEMSTEDSQLFVDVCIPALADLRWGPFTNHFKWGISKDEIPQFFTTAGWRVSSSYLDDHAHGKDVGQKGLILVHGFRDLSGVGGIPTQVQSVESIFPAHEISVFSKQVVVQVLPQITQIIEVYNRDSNEGAAAYIEFIRENESDLQTIAKGQRNQILLGQISPRLLGDPLSIERDVENRTDTEIESFIVGNLRAILQLMYCGVKGIQAEQFKGTPMDIESKHVTNISRFESLLPLVEIMKQATDV